MQEDKVSEMRRALVEYLKGEGAIRARAVEEAFLAVPRHLFVPDVPLEGAYSDRPVVIKKQDGVPISSSSQPSMMAIMLEQLELGAGQRVLEIGAGSGYNAALMAHIVGDSGRVVSVDIDEDLVDGAREHLGRAGYGHVQVVRVDGAQGYPDEAPYDRIVLTVGAWDIAPAWWEQLSPGGRLLLPISLNGTQKSVAFDVVGDHLESRSVRDCGFMRLRGAFAGPGRIVQIGPEPGLLLATESGEEIDGASVYALLSGPSRDLDTGVEVAEREVWSGLNLWMSLRDRCFCEIVAEGAWAERGVVPYLFGFPGAQASRLAAGYFRPQGLCCWMRPGGLPTDEKGRAEPFALHLRAFGAEGEGLAAHALEQIGEWNATGRPGTEGLSISAYKAGADMPNVGEEVVVISKPQSMLVLRWGAANK